MDYKGNCLPCVMFGRNTHTHNISTLKFNVSLVVFDHLIHLIKIVYGQERLNSLKMSSHLHLSKI